MKINLSSYLSGRFGEIGVRLAFLLLVIIVNSFFGSVADAKSGNLRLIDQMKTQLDAAIENGDAKAAKEIWGSIDSTFSNKFDGLAARAALSTLTPSRLNILQKLSSTSSSKFEKIALFLSSINQSNLMGNNPSTGTGKLSGMIRGGDNKRLAGAKVIAAGQKTTTNVEGTFAFEAIPSGMYDMFVLASGHKLAINRSVSTNKSNSSGLDLRLTALNAAPPPTPEEVRAKMEMAFAQMGKALTPPKSTGTETIEGTLLDEDTGKPIAKAQVMMGCKTAIKSTTSDAQGHFVLTGIPTEVCDFTVMKSNITLANALQEIKAGKDRSYGFSQRYNISAQPDHKYVKTWKIKVKSIDLGETVKGIVLNARDGMPVPDAEVPSA